jgi:hypothetical protein
MFQRRRLSRWPSCPDRRAQLGVEELEARTLLSVYYVSPTGNDLNSGLAGSPWQTIARVNQQAASATPFQPGDQILFQGGATFVGNLAFNAQNNGAAGNAIAIGSYGTGSATLSAGSGVGIALTGASHFQIMNLVVVGAGYTISNGSAIFSSNNSGIYVSGNGTDYDISNVDVSGFGGAGIALAVDTTTVLNGSGYVDSGQLANVSVKYSALHDNGVGGLDAHGVTNIYVGHVQTYHNTGNTPTTETGFGILLKYTYAYPVNGNSHGVVERCLSYDNGWSAGNTGACGGIEAIGGDHFLMQSNEVYNNHAGNGDGDGVIMDITTNSMEQFNYTHGNDGSGLWVGAEPNNTGNHNTIRYNISENDGQKTGYGNILLWLAISNTDVYNNTAFTNINGPAVNLVNLSGSSNHLRNNILVTTGGRLQVTYTPGNPPAQDLLFQGNDYWPSGSSGFKIQWLSSSYNSLTKFRNGTGQEKLNGSNVGYQINPSLNNPGGGGTIGNADALNSLTAYKLQGGSTLGSAGLNLSQLFLTTWDPYGYASDPFMSHYFDLTPRDFYGNALPITGRSVGAYQPVAAVNLVPNSGFETPYLGTGASAYQYNPTGASWTFSGSSGVAGNGSAFTYYNPNAPEGTQVGFIQGGGDISQSISGLPAGSYMVFFRAAQRANYNSDFNHNDFQVLIDGNVVGTFLPTSTSYTIYTTTGFNLTVGSHTLEFRGLDSIGGDNTVFLDQVTLLSPWAVNAGFESPNVGTGFQAQPAGAGWTFTGSSGIAGNGSVWTSGNPNAPEGTQIAYLQGAGADLSQSISGWQAATYTVSVEAAMRGNYGGANDFQVLVDGVVVGTFLPTSTSYATYTTNSFTVTAGSHVLEFKGLDTAGGDNTVFLDAVSIVDPEPNQDTIIISAAGDGNDVTRTKLCANQACVTQLTLDLLHRPVDASGLAFWPNTLDQSALSRFGLALTIQTGPEYRALDVQSQHQSMLGRQAESGGLDNGAAFLNSGRSIDHLKSILYGSEEFWNSAWVAEPGAPANDAGDDTLMVDKSAETLLDFELGS